MGEVFRTFLRLGVTSFGGPIAHLGYFRREFVERRAWLDEALFAHLVAFCSILPGPTSSQVGMLVGLLRAGPPGALAAWLGFTLPSAIALTLVAFVLASFAAPGGATPPAWFNGVMVGLGAAATAIVAQAVLGMTATLCTDRATRTIGAGAAILALSLAADPTWQWVPIAAGGLAGLAFCRSAGAAAVPGVVVAARLPRGVSLAAGALFVTVVAATAVIGQRSPAGFFVATVVRAGSLVFGGGHVVLPLLHALVPAGLVSGRLFFAGYGATQAMPGPLFTFAAFLGAANHSRLHGVAGAVVATLLIFLPSFLLVFAALPVLGALRANRAATGALRGANASVVGLLGAVLYAPLIISLGSSVWRVAITLGAFGLVAIWKTPPWIAVVTAAAVGAGASAAGLLRYHP